jgi:hypothetical protein
VARRWNFADVKMFPTTPSTSTRHTTNTTTTTTLAQYSYHWRGRKKYIQPLEKLLELLNDICIYKIP